MRKLFESKTIDMSTGEIMSITTVTVKKINEKFTMCRTTDGLNWLKQFTNKELQMLIVLNDMENLTTKLVSLTPLIRQEIQSFFGISKSTLSGMLTAMEDKAFLVRLSNSDIMLNPSYFYKGESKEVYKRIQHFREVYEEIRKKNVQEVENQSENEQNPKQNKGKS